MDEQLNHLYPNRIIIPETKEDLPNDKYMVYILTYNDTAIVVGKGKKNRARVIFDDIDNITRDHVKAMLVRLYRLFGNGTFNRYIIICDNKEEAQIIESNLHKQILGNNIDVPQDIRVRLFNNIAPDSTTALLLEIALRSSYDGISDLRKWRRNELINNATWEQISERLQLSD